MLHFNAQGLKLYVLGLVYVTKQYGKTIYLLPLTF